MRTFTLCRHLSTTVTATTVITATAPVVPPLVRKCAIISTSNDVFANLALEHWIYKHVPFSSFVKKSDNESDSTQGRNQQSAIIPAQRHLLMLWVNEPCVVVGRHQNPWHECDVAGALRRTGGALALARRNSGGGTVYHDLGNLNLTFFTPPDHYNRRYNLEFIAAAIFRDYTLKVDINKREDLIVRERKVSGTAAKVARHAAYHHCTLLVEADLDQMRRSLAGSVDWEIQTNATKSTRTKIVNLRDEQPRITVPNLTRSLAARYLQQNNINNNNDQNVAQSVVAKDSLSSESAICCPIDFDALTVQTVDPTEQNFPGLNEIIAEYRSWEWIYGRCPKFTASKVFFKHQGHRDEYVGESQSNDGVVYIKGETFSYRVNVFVENGLIIDVDLLVPEDRGISDSDAIYTKLREVRLAFIGQRYDPIVTKQIENLFADSDDAQLIRFNV